MSLISRTLLGTAALAAVAGAQTPQPSTLTVPAPIHAGTFHAATGTFQPSTEFIGVADGTTGAIFKSNYYTARFYDISDGTVIYDEGRVPSTTSPSPVGLANSYRVTGIQLAYATDSLDPVSMRVRFWHSYETCSDPSTLPAPIADIVLTNMPGTIQAGAFTPYTFDIDMTSREFCILADGDGIYDSGDGADRFGFAIEVLDAGNGTETGPIVGLRPGPFAPTGAGTVFLNPGAAAGSGLGAADQWYDVEPATGAPFGFTTALPGAFIDISGTGTALNLGDDNEANVTMTVGNAVFAPGTIRIGANGGIRFAGAGTELGWTNSTLPQASNSGGTGCFGGSQALLPYWDDLLTSSSLAGTNGNVYWQEVGGTMIVQWNNVTFFGTGGTERITFQVQIPSTGPAAAQIVYSDVQGALPNGGASATIGYQDGGIETTQQFSFNTAGAVSNGTVLSLLTPPLPGQENCFNWGGYEPLTNNPAFGSFWLVLESDLGINCTGCDNDIDDALEQNDDCASAIPVAVPSVITNLVADNADEDWYLFGVPANTALTARIDFLHAQADLDLTLLADDCSTVLASSGSVTNSESVTFFNCGLTPVNVRLRVFEFGFNACGDYSLTTTLDTTCDIDDLLEDNDSCSQTFPLSLGFTPNMRIKACDEDYYSLDADPGETLNLGIFFQDAIADLDLFLYQAGGNCGTPAGLLTFSNSTTNDEFLTWTNTTGQVQNYVLFVDFAAPGTANCATYQIAYTRIPSTEVGFQFCTAVLNSTNRGAHIFATGSDVRANNDLTLGCTFLPNNSNGYFLNSLTNIFLPNPGGSLGNLCIAGIAVGRFNGNVLNSGGTGQVALPIDLSAIPRPTGTVSVMPGQTWYFQYWYRDVVGGSPVSNLSDAVGILFL